MLVAFRISGGTSSYHWAEKFWLDTQKKLIKNWWPEAHFDHWPHASQVILFVIASRMRWVPNFLHCGRGHTNPKLVLESCIWKLEFSEICMKKGTSKQWSNILNWCLSWIFRILWDLHLISHPKFILGIEHVLCGFICDGKPFEFQTNLQICGVLKLEF